MSSSLLGLILALPTPVVPAPKSLGVPAEIIDRLPEDTAAVLVVDVPRVARSAIGKHFISRLHPHLEEWLPLETTAKEVEYAVLAQYAIEQFAGDFCFLLRLRDGAELPAKLQQGSMGDPLKVGEHTVYKLKAGTFFGMLNKRTAALVLLTSAPNSDEAAARELQAVFGDEKKGPGETLRRKLVGFRPESALALVSDHPKSGLSATLSLSPFGYQSLNLTGLADKIRRYTGEVTLSDKLATMELRFEAKSTNAAEELRDALESERVNISSGNWSKLLRKDMSIARDKTHVTLKARLTHNIIDGLLGPN
jgi:hypothetical protein